jgi:hypothetical protein
MSGQLALSLTNGDKSVTEEAVVRRGTVGNRPLAKTAEAQEGALKSVDPVAEKGDDNGGMVAKKEKTRMRRMRDFFASKAKDIAFNMVDYG